MLPKTVAMSQLSSLHISRVVPWLFILSTIRSKFLLEDLFWKTPSVQRDKQIWERWQVSLEHCCRSVCGHASGSVLLGIMSSVCFRKEGGCYWKWKCGTQYFVYSEGGTLVLLIADVFWFTGVRDLHSRWQISSLSIFLQIPAHN